MTMMTVEKGEERVNFVYFYFGVRAVYERRRYVYQIFWQSNIFACSWGKWTMVKRILKGEDDIFHPLTENVVCSRCCRSRRVTCGKRKGEFSTTKEKFRGIFGAFQQRRTHEDDFPRTQQRGEISEILARLMKIRKWKLILTSQVEFLE